MKKDARRKKATDIECMSINQYSIPIYVTFIYIYMGVCLKDTG